MEREVLIILGLFVLFVLGYLALNLLAGQWGSVTFGVKVHDTYGGAVEGAKVDLYKGSSDSVESQDSLIATADTDNNGVANFNGISISGLMHIRISKDGYISILRDITESDKVSGFIDVYLNEEPKPLRVTVEGGSGYGGYNPVAGARVDLYNNTGYSAYSYGTNYVLLDTKYTDDYGVVNFGKVNIDSGEVVVSKDGYYNSTMYVSTFSRNISVYLTAESYSYHEKGQLVVTVKEGDYIAGGYWNLGHSPITEARVDLYNGSGNQPGYTLIRTEYTNEDGIADFGEIDIYSDKVVVSKDGYHNYTEDVTYPESITVYLLPENNSYIYNISNYTGRPLVVTVQGSNGYSTRPQTMTLLSGARVDVYNETSLHNYALVLTNYSDSNGIANFGKIKIEKGKIETSKEGYVRDLQFFSSSTPRGIAVYLYPQGLIKVIVDGGGASNTPLGGANVGLYNRIDEINYGLIKMLTTDSNGVADFGNVSCDMIQVSKEGYGTYTISGIIPTGGVTVHLYPKGST
jgi:hypothetical protein